MLRLAVSRRRDSAVRKALGAGVAALAGMVMFSGCFIMRELSFKDDTVQAGEKAVAKISVLGENQGATRRGVGEEEEYPFFYFQAEGDSTLANGGKFDTEGVFDGPVKLVKDGALAELASEDCDSEVARRGPPSGATTVVTEDPFVATNVRKFMDVKLPIRVSEAGNIDAFAISMGTWIDDGDGIPEDDASTDDSYFCQPPYASAIRIKGGAPLPP